MVITIIGVFGCFATVSVEAVSQTGINVPNQRIELDNPGHSNLLAGADTTLSAEHLLNSLARDKRTNRTIGGGMALGGGVLLLVISARLSVDPPNLPFWKPLGLILGGTCIVSGAVLLAVPSRTESEATDVREITDQVDRERAAYSSLISLTERARRQRFLGGAISVGLGLSWLLAPEDSARRDETLGLLSIGEGLYYLLFKSPEEKILARYESAHREPGVKLNISPALLIGESAQVPGIALRLSFGTSR